MPCPANELGVIVPFNWIARNRLYALALWRTYLLAHSGTACRANTENRQHQEFEQSNLVVRHPIEKREEP
jgi:hypothetical protein